MTTVTKRFSIHLIILLSVFLIASSAAAQEVERLLSIESETIAVHKEIQKTKENWEKEKTALKRRLRELEAETLRASKTRDALKAKVEDKKKALAALKRGFPTADASGREMKRYLAGIIDRLEGFIKDDMPFLQEERSKRISSVRETLDAPDTTAGEKYRRVMEALQVEAEYGKTVETYQDAVQVGGKEIVADILRIGRIAIFYRSPDGSLIGRYDRENGRWEHLSGKCRPELNRAFEMAAHRRAADLVELKLGRAEGLK